eukprot:GDKI01027016.1.p2 GENE.GDKI01027016.1~~GDKI01027016.1.p2  ORF type:complete len:100 (-),score=9.29 GDKI01027016.1:42-341(-)
MLVCACAFRFCLSCMDAPDRQVHAHCVGEVASGCTSKQLNAIPDGQQCVYMPVPMQPCMAVAPVCIHSYVCVLTQCVYVINYIALRLCVFLHACVRSCP